MKTSSAQNVIAGWLGQPVPYLTQPKPHRRPYRKHSARRIREAQEQARRTHGAPVVVKRIER